MAQTFDELSNLLALAHRRQLEAIVPHVGPGQKYDALMIANALAIASRLLKDGAAAQHSEAARYRTALNKDGTLLELKALMAQSIRAGAFDDDEAIFALLQTNARAALGLTNPKALDEADATRNKTQNG
ncbi:MAG: DUF6285 domain-containing protein [Pseudomonadota bacterium]